jgi:hypothetical protein
MRLSEIGDNIISKIADHSQLPRAWRPTLRTLRERQAGARAKLEKELHNQFAGWLNRHENWFSAIHADPSKPATIKAGWPDFTVSRANLQLLIEFKVPPNGLTESQQERFPKIEQAGNTIYICDSYQDAVELTLEHFGIKNPELLTDY